VVSFEQLVVDALGTLKTKLDQLLEASVTEREALDALSGQVNNVVAQMGGAVDVVHGLVEKLSLAVAVSPDVDDSDEIASITEKLKVAAAALGEAMTAAKSAVNPPVVDPAPAPAPAPAPEPTPEPAPAPVDTAPAADPAPVADPAPAADPAPVADAPVTDTPVTDPAPDATH